MPITNINHREMVQSMTDFQADLLKNPYYLFSDKKAVIVEYYNLNATKSTLDEALKINYSNLGKDSPLWFNVIHNFYLYGIERVMINLENGEFGLESSEISGDAMVLPDTITPYPGDYFTISHVSKKYLFKVIDVTYDTFNNGANYWKIGYKLDRLEDTNVKKKVIEEYEFHTGTVGTQFNSVIKKSKWDLATKLDMVAVQLKRFYKALYFNNKVQTFTYVHLYQVCQSNMSSDFFYDPYMIEFIINNRVLANDGDEYIYIGHKTNLYPEFPIRYAKSIWRVLETREIDNIGSCLVETNAKYIGDPSTIFATRYEDYFELTYSPIYPAFQQVAPPVPIFDPQVIGFIKENQLFEYDGENAVYNIIIKYMNHQDVTIDDLIPYEKIEEFDSTERNYFLIPMAIFCIEYYIHKLLSKTS